MVKGFFVQEKTDWDSHFKLSPIGVVKSFAAVGREGNMIQACFLCTDGTASQFADTVGRRDIVSEGVVHSIHNTTCLLIHFVLNDDYRTATPWCLLIHFAFNDEDRHTTPCFFFHCAFDNEDRKPLMVFFSGARRFTMTGGTPTPSGGACPGDHGGLPRAGRPDVASERSESEEATSHSPQGRLKTENPCKSTFLLFFKVD